VAVAQPRVQPGVRLHPVPGAETSDDYFDRINEALATEAFRPRALFDRFNIETLATTEGPQDKLEHHKAIRDSGWGGHVITAYRPDAVIDFEDERFGRPSSASARSRARTSPAGRAIWKATACAAGVHRGRRHLQRPRPSDRRHRRSLEAEAEALFQSLLKGEVTPAKAELFRAQMLTEMARMSLDDGLVMQIHPGSHRNHNTGLLASHGRDKGADIPMRTEYVDALKPLLTGSATTRACRSSSSPWTRRSTAASWPRWPATIRC
jgi:glucuronate isomerase